ncbi:MAG TPA: hypothetical protein VHS05_09140 [Pyrinomonadaceae bacterium]|nr:hypothetical protein [Pyrinomonadaceae bacterium]
MTRITDAVLLTISRTLLAIERWWDGLGLSRKSEARIIAIGMFLGVNVLGFILGRVVRWLGLKPGVDIRPMPTFRGSFLVSEIMLLLVVFMFYRSRVKDIDTRKRL